MKRQGRLLVIVPNGVTGDSRVQKTAMVAAHAGWDVTLLGTSGSRPERRTWMGPVEVVRHPIRRPLHDAYESALTAGRSEVRQALSAARRRLRGARRWRRVREAAHGALAVARATGRTAAARLRGGEIQASEHDWRTAWPILRDWQNSFVPAIVQCQPDVIHSNDAIMLGVAAEAVAQIRAAGGSVGWLHDVHEYTRGVDWGGPHIDAAFRAYEREYIDAPDALVTVSPELAAMLQADFELVQPPLVVRNAPIASVEAACTTTLRDVVGLDDEPLLVSSGSISRKRGIQSVIAALPALEGVHLAIVTSAAVGRNPVLDRLLEEADELGVRERVHVAPYVAAHLVPHYLSTADVGVFAGLRYPNHEISLPTKFPEYLHARLPILTSDVRTASAFVRNQRVGAVFAAGDVESLVEAARTILSKKDEFRAAITPALLQELSWEHQTAPLVELYSSLSGLRPRAEGTTPSWILEEASTRP